MKEFARVELSVLCRVESRQVLSVAGRSLREVRPIRHQICLCIFLSTQLAHDVAREQRASRSSKRKVYSAKTLSDGASI